MAYTQAQNKASQKYQREHMELIAIRVPKGDRQRLKEAADAAGLSMAAYVIEAVNEKAGTPVLSVPGQRSAAPVGGTPDTADE